VNAKSYCSLAPITGTNVEEKKISRYYTVSTLVRGRSGQEISLGELALSWSLSTRIDCQEESFLQHFLHKRFLTLTFPILIITTHQT
jgi:hypothetical protein